MCVCTLSMSVWVLTYELNWHWWVVESAPCEACLLWLSLKTLSVYPNWNFGAEISQRVAQTSLLSTLTILFWSLRTCLFLLQHERDPGTRVRPQKERAVGPSCRNIDIVEKEIRAMLSAKQCHHHLDFPKTEKVKFEMECFFVFFRKEQRKTSLKKRRRYFIDRSNMFRLVDFT